VTDGETNASVPNGTDPAGLSLDDARALIEARRNAPPRANRRGPRGGRDLAAATRGPIDRADRREGQRPETRQTKSTKRKIAH
jgi:topoisomerase IA-like protein